MANAAHTLTGLEGWSQHEEAGPLDIGEGSLQVLGQSLALSGASFTRALISFRTAPPS